jgi:hypothetical protein
LNIFNFIFAILSGDLKNILMRIKIKRLE